MKHLVVLLIIAFITHIICKFYPRKIKKIEHNHAHSFMEVVEIVYYCPESFSIDKVDYEFYSKQELKYLKRLQSYLLAIGLKDIEKYNKKELIKRAKTKKVKQFSEYQIIEQFKD